MLTTQTADLGQAARRLRALGDETRLRILGMLVPGEVCVCELAAALELPQPLISFHLRTLREAGLVEVQRRGRWAFYTLNPTALEQAGRLTLRIAADHRKARRLARRCC